MKRNGRLAAETYVPEEVYTDRKEYIDFFYNEALRAIGRRTMSTVFLGQRRMGKTEIFKRVVNRLFFEQDHEDPNAAIPVYYEFPEVVSTPKDFALGYVENFIRWYAAFRLRDPEILSEPGNCLELFDLIKEKMDATDKFNHAMNLWKAIEKDRIVVPEQKAVQLPRVVAFSEDSTIVVFLDEFQNIHLPNYNFHIVGYLKGAVESPRCPHFVTGSAMSILADELIGRGALYGRFDYERIKPFPDYWGAELARRSARYHGADLAELMAPIVSERCGGNPFYITAVVRRAAKLRKKIDNETKLNELLAIDVASGFIWAELNDQVNKWIDRVNEYGITKWVLYLAAMEDGEKISLERIQNELRDHEKIDAPIDQIKDVLIKLARGDLIEYISLDLFCKIKDPILNEFLKVWGQIIVKSRNPDRIANRTIEKFTTIQKRFFEYKGYMAEVYMIQILWNAQGRTLPGRCFNVDEDVDVPSRFSYIDQRHKPGTGKKMEVDIYAAAGPEIWMAESKWWSGDKVGTDVVETLLRQAEIVRERKREVLKTLRLWIFAHDGVTGPAEELMRQNGMLWSTRVELDELLETVKLRKLPVLGGSRI